MMKKLSLFVIAVLTVLSVSAAAKENLSVDGSTTVGPVAKAFAGYYMQENPDVNISVSMTGSGNGAKSLIQGACDIAAMSRFMHSSEYKKAISNDVFPVPHMVALDGIAIVVHPSNPVSKLSLAQLKKIYTGEITSWKELGGPDRKIVKISRDTSSGTYEVFSKMVLHGEPIDNAEYVKSNGAIRARVKNTRAAIGYVGLGFLNSVKPVTIEGIKPTMKTVGSGAYPLARPLYFWTDGYPEVGSDMFRFIMLYQTEVGKQIVKDIGFVPVGG